MVEQLGKGKAEVILMNDFTTYDATVLEKLKGAHGVVWALGISQTQVSKEYAGNHCASSELC
jgi:hypothetical protein